MADCFAVEHVWWENNILLATSLCIVVNVEIGFCIDGVVLGTCVDIISPGDFDDGELGFELAGDRPIVR